MSECELLGCARIRWANGLCRFHDDRRRKGRPLDAPYKYRPRKTCCTRCGDAHYAKGLCRFHYDRHRQGIPLDAPRRSIGFFDWAACGTPAQYQKHLRYKIPACPACRRAENRRVQDRAT